MNLGIIRSAKTSLYDHLYSKLVADNYIITASPTASQVTLMERYPDDEELKQIVFYKDRTGSTDEIVLPVVSIDEVGPTEERDLELGSNTPITVINLILTVFGETSNQVDNIRDVLVDYLRSTITLKNYNSNYSSPTDAGKIFVNNIRSIPIRFVESPNKALKWGCDILFNLEVNNTDI